MIAKIKKVCFLSCHNQYASKRYFTQKLTEALTRQGIEVHIMAWPHGPFPIEHIKKIKELQPDLTLSFHQFPPQENGRFFWDDLKIPHWSILLDPVFYDLELAESPYSIISCVDKGDCKLLLSRGFTNTFFFPHAVEKELIENAENDRPIDVIMLGTCYDPDHLHAYWKKNLPPHIVTVLEDASERVLSDDNTTFLVALIESITSAGVDPNEVEIDRLAHYVDQYSRGIDRLKLIQSIKNVSVHVYGGKSWREELPIADWNYYLSKQSNVIVYPEVNFAESIHLLKKSKICLNRMPFFKNGSHERVFTSMACGAIPLSSKNAYLQSIFKEGEEILFYEPYFLEKASDQVDSLIHDPSKRLLMLKNAQHSVASNHTWDHRVTLFLDACKMLSFFQ